MKKGFFVINIIILVGIIALVYFGYTDYYLKNKFDIKDEEVKTSVDEESASKETAVDSKNKETEIQPQTTTKPQTQPAQEQAAPSKQETEILEETPVSSPEIAKSDEVPETTPQTQNGYYKNTTYNYEITVPASWPLKVREESNISLGTVPPKNGQGAITIEVGDKSLDQEIKRGEAEAKRYSGMIEITKEPITLSGMTGEKMILNNLIIERKDIYILLEKSGLYYLIKYSEESAEFTKEAKAAVNTFKFTK